MPNAAPLPTLVPSTLSVIVPVPLKPLTSLILTGLAVLVEGVLSSVRRLTAGAPALPATSSVRSAPAPAVCVAKGTATSLIVMVVVSGPAGISV